MNDPNLRRRNLRLGFTLFAVFVILCIVAVIIILVRN
jgi:competence protein ComGC